MGYELDLDGVTNGHPLAKQQLSDLMSDSNRHKQRAEAAEAECKALKINNDTAVEEVKRLQARVDEFQSLAIDLAGSLRREGILVESIEGEGVETKIAES